MHLAILLNLLLSTTLAADGLDHREYREVNESKRSIHFDNLTHDYSPTGPADFITTIHQGTTALDPEACLQLALGAVSAQVLEVDWQSRLPEFVTVWKAAQGPCFVAQSIGPQPMEQRFALWAIVRIMDRMVQENHYIASRADLSWRGSRIGVLSIVPKPSMGNHKAIHLPVLENAATRLGSHGLSWEDIEYFGAKNSISEVFMGTLSSVIKAAERPDGNINSFVGEWRESPYSIFQIWWTTKRPTQLSKKILIASMVETMNYATQRKDYRCLKCVVRKHGQYIGEGGYAVYPPPTKF